MTDKRDLEGISYQGPMSEDEYLATVERIQQAMAIEPFLPSVIDVVKLLSDWRTLTNQNKGLLIRSQMVDQGMREIERLKADYDAAYKNYVVQRDENEWLRVISDAACAFVQHQQRGQPGTPDTLYPMTYGVQDEWHAEWDRRLEALIAACQR